MHNNSCRHLSYKETFSLNLLRLIWIYSKIITRCYLIAGVQDKNRIAIETIVQIILHSFLQLDMNISQKCLNSFCNSICIWIKNTLQYMEFGIQSSTCKMLRIVSQLLIINCYNSFCIMINSLDGMR